MTIGVDDMVAFGYTKPKAKRPQTVIALVVKWNGNLDRPGLLISTAFERYWRFIDAATFFSAWTGLFAVGASNGSGSVVLTAAHAKTCRRSIEAYLATDDGKELLDTRWKQDDSFVVPAEGRGHLENHELPLQPFPAHGLGLNATSESVSQMDKYCDAGARHRKFLRDWQERQPRVYDQYARSLHHREPGGIEILNPTKIDAA